jgi:hypothetical protein
MTVKEQINQDIKSSMLAGDKILTTTLRGIKSAILNAEIAKNSRESGLNEEEIIAILQKEAKKRQESYELYERGGNADRARAELAEKTVIESYLPEQMNDAELEELVESAITTVGASQMKDMGLVIAEAKRLADNKANGSRIATAVKKRLKA